MQAKAQQYSIRNNTNKHSTRNTITVTVIAIVKAIIVVIIIVIVIVSTSTRLTVSEGRSKNESTSGDNRNCKINSHVSYTLTSSIPLIISLISVPYIIPRITPLKEFRL